MIDDTSDDGYYHYGEIIILKQNLLEKTNSEDILDYNDGNIHELYRFDHPATEQTLDLTDYRYIGNAPNNYVNFNDELWRIIGIFKVEDDDGNLEERVKIVRNESLGSKV